MGIDMDFADHIPTAQPSPTVIAAALWDVGVWDTGLWSGGSEITKAWQGITGIGTYAAARLRIVTNGASAEIHCFDVLAEPGAII